MTGAILAIVALALVSLALAAAWRGEAVRRELAEKSAEHSEAGRARAWDDAYAAEELRRMAVQRADDLAAALARQSERTHLEEASDDEILARASSAADASRARGGAVSEPAPSPAPVAGGAGGGPSLAALRSAARAERRAVGLRPARLGSPGSGSGR